MSYQPLRVTINAILVSRSKAPDRLLNGNRRAIRAAPPVACAM